MEQQSTWELVQAHLRQPEYLHVLLNPLPVYGLALGILAMVVALALRSRSAQITALVIVFVSALSAAPVIHYGERAYDRVKSMSDHGGDEWLDAHAQRAERAEPAFYILAALAAAALIVPWKWPKCATLLSVSTLVGAVIVLGLGIWIAYAGGQIRHKEFRYGSPSEAPGGYEKMRD